MTALDELEKVIIDLRYKNQLRTARRLVGEVRGEYNTLVALNNRSLWKRLVDWMKRGI